MLDKDKAFVGRYAIALQLEMIADYDMYWEKDRWARRAQSSAWGM